MHRVSAAPDRSLLIVGFGSQLFGVDASTGAVRWEVTLGEQNNLQEVEIAIADGVVIAANSTAIYFVDYRTGQLYGEAPMAHKDTVRPVMLVDENLLYVTGNGAVSAYTLRGQVVWTQPFEGKKSWGNVANVSLAMPDNIRQADATR